MFIHNHIHRNDRVNPRVGTIIADPKGNILVYLVVVILIFGVLGVSLVSLFTTATGSSATPNDAKRARFIAESGIRYALSEIRNSDDVENAATLLNTTTEFNLGTNGGFTANVFSPGLRSAENKNIVTSGTLIIDVPYSGEFPDDFTIPNADVWAVDWRLFTGSPPPDISYSAISGSALADPPESVTLNLADDFNADLEDTVCFALQSTVDGTNITRGSSIFVHENASAFFPNENGAIRIVTLSDGQTYDYFYERRQPPSGGQVELTNLREMPGDTWTNIADLRTGDYVILSPYNFRVFAAGTSDQTTVEVGRDRPFWALAVPSEYTIYMRELLQDRSIVQEGDVIRTQEGGDRKIELGKENVTDPPGFGDLWYGGEKSIGGDQNYCQEGRCRFDRGIRVFYTTDVIPGANGGQGFTFALIAGGSTFVPINTRLSGGGDFQLPELLAYGGAGLESDGTFLDDSVDGRDGLQPPKMALEFDTLTDLNVPLDYCAGNNIDLIPGSRNDPQPDGVNRDVVQYVFWGSDVASDLPLTCRSEAVASYDDNRHDAEGDQPSLNFTFPTGAPVQSDPTFDSTDQTVYFGSDDSPTDNFWAVRSNGELKWSFNAGNTDVRSKPALDTFLGWRHVYFNATNGNLFRMRADDGSQLGMTMNIGVSVGNTDSPSPVVDRNHQVYIGSTANLSFYAYENVDPFFWRLRWSRLLGQQVDAPPVVDLTGGAYDGTIYVGRDRDADPTGGRVFSFDQDGTWNPNWGGTENDAFITDLNVDTKPALSNDGSRIYVVDDSGIVYSIHAATGTEEWRWDLNEPVDFVHPAVDTSGVGFTDGTIYVPTNGGRLYALQPSLGIPWLPPWPIDFGTGLYSSPIVGPDGTIYIGTDGGLVYAINSDGSFKWQFSTGNGMHIRSSPDLGDDGTVYVGSDDGNLYAIATVALPRNYRNNYVNFQQGYLTSDNLDSNVVVDDPDNWLDGSPMSKGPWAVRTEIKRATSVNANGNYEYTLLIWIRQCAQSDCSDIRNTPFQDTTGEYTFLPGPPFPDLPFEQVIELTPAEHNQFERFLFGFTTAAGATDTQTVEIRDFQLTFIQSGDPTIISDTWLP